jgi:PTS system nitrogen regulatory IIA component
MTELLRPDNIIRVAHVLGDEVLADLADLAAARDWVGDAKTLLALLLERERLGSTAVGSSIAIPHAKVEGLDGVRVALAIAGQGVDFGARDGSQTRLFFLVLSGPAVPALHIRVLALVSRIARTEGLAEALSAVASASEAHARIAACERSEAVG